MKKQFLGLCVLSLMTNFAFANDFSCPAKSLSVYSCNAVSKSATSDELKNSVKSMLVCHSTATGKKSLVIQGKNGASQVLAAKNYREMEMSIYEVESDDSIVPVLEINTEIDQKNAVYTDFMKGGEVKLTCKKTR